MNNRDAIATAVASVLARQSFVLQRKETFITVAVAVVWVGSTLIEQLTSAPDWFAVVVGCATSLAAALVIALTKGAIPPSALPRILDSYDMEVGKTVDVGPGVAEAVGAPDAEPVPAASILPPDSSRAPRHAAERRFSLYG
ncbi:hypothetical protein I6J72_05400 [Corynebacterium sp. FDAARGOS 1242]|uniref:hypothetical protein n=1 Tax=Corynebacterium sp. FDAARGOS 1242 TaxID=2778078 RepID=UPI00194E432D|nr:hypothetical protein [Corynebacterium sp. FDAARGOS 1242]QRP98936.1 hypothetical protein I6J72_05400 [Corynebacterium sp. FDAARGOS 1242]